MVNCFCIKQMAQQSFVIKNMQTGLMHIRTYRDYGNMRGAAHAQARRGLSAEAASGHWVPLNWEAICNWHLLAKGKLVSWWSIAACIKHTQREPLFVLLVFLVIFLSFEKERETGWVGRWLGSGKSWGRRKHDQDIVREKILLKRCLFWFARSHLCEAFGCTLPLNISECLGSWPRLQGSLIISAACLCFVFG